MDCHLKLWLGLHHSVYFIDSLTRSGDTLRVRNGNYRRISAELIMQLDRTTHRPPGEWVDASFFAMGGSKYGIHSGSAFHTLGHADLRHGILVSSLCYSYKTNSSSQAMASNWTLGQVNSAGWSQPRFLFKNLGLVCRWYPLETLWRALPHHRTGVDDGPQNHSLKERWVRYPVLLKNWR